MSAMSIFIKKCSCIICGKIVTVQNINKHYNSKSCNLKTPIRVKLSSCPHCSISFENNNINIGNHVRWCKDNPLYFQYRSYKNENGEPIRVAWNKGLTKETSQPLATASTKISKRWSEGVYSNIQVKAKESKIKNGTYRQSPSLETREKIRRGALESNHQRVYKKTHEFIDKRGRKFKFDSTWEDTLAIRLDDLDINWDRPHPIKYELNGKFHNYFPDFYLPDYDLYLDPKNSYAIKMQLPKLEVVSKMINLIILKNLDECKNFEIDGAAGEN